MKGNGLGKITGWLGVTFLAISAPALAQDAQPPLSGSALPATSSMPDIGALLHQTPPSAPFISPPLPPEMPSAVTPEIPSTITPNVPSTVTPNAPVTIPCDQCCETAGSIFFDAEYLLLRPRRRALDYAIAGPNSQDAPLGTIQSLDWRTRSGFRVGGGYECGDGWEAGAYYFNLHSNASGTQVRPAGGMLFATLTHPGTIEQVDTATATSGVNFDVIDLEIGKSFTMGECFWLRLFGGGRFASIDQSLNAFYNGGDATFAEVHSPIEFDGGGVRVGGEGRWKFNWGLSLFARASGSLLFGDFRSSLLQTNNSGATTDVSVVDDFQKIVPVLEMGVGVAWQYRNLQISAGYEIANWFGLVDSPDFVDDVHQGKFVRRVSDLSLDGLVAQVRMSF